MTHQRQFAAKNRNGRRTTQPAAPRRMQEIASPGVVRRAAEDGASMLFGLGFGAALMFLLDPKSGRNRRHLIVDSARQRVSDAGMALAGRARHAVDYASDEFSHGATHAMDHLRENIPTTWRNRASNWLRPQHHSIAPAAGITAGGIALIGLGAGLAYFFDPYRGRARRNVAVNVVRETGDRMMNRGKELAEDFQQRHATEIEREPSMAHREAAPNEI